MTEYEWAIRSAGTLPGIGKSSVITPVRFPIMLREEYYSVWCEDKSYLEEEAQTKRVASFSYFRDALDYAHQLTRQGVVPCTVRSVPVGGHCNHWHYTQPQGATPCDSTL